MPELPSPSQGNAETTGAPVHTWVHGPLPRGVDAVLDRLRRTPGVLHVAVMPDVHLASEFCVGTVVASQEWVFPNAVGGDIGCGMLAMRFDGDAHAIADPEKAALILGMLEAACPGRRHHRRASHSLPADLRDASMSDARLEAAKNGEESRIQLGTLGAGNHFLELQADESDGALWLMLHTGSRNLGQIVLQHHLPKARRLDTGLFALAADSGLAQAYLADVAVTRRWARENRRLLAQRAGEVVERVLGFAPQTGTLHDCDHNHVVLETHAGTAAWVHRKGATAAGENVAGIIPGSMGTRSFHTLGRGHANALCSSSHGAGRALSRTEARDRVTISALRQQIRGVWYDSRIERHLREEAPMAYKPIDAVMHAQADLTQVVRRLRPMLVYKGT